jgi:hypothetical protein
MFRDAMMLSDSLRRSQVMSTIEILCLLNSFRLSSISSFGFPFFRRALATSSGGQAEVQVNHPVLLSIASTMSSTFELSCSRLNSFTKTLGSK